MLDSSGIESGRELIFLNLRQASVARISFCVVKTDLWWYRSRTQQCETAGELAAGVRPTYQMFNQILPGIEPADTPKPTTRATAIHCFIL